MTRFSDSGKTSSMSSSMLFEYLESKTKKSQLFALLNLLHDSSAILVFPDPDCPWISTALFALIKSIMLDISSSLYSNSFDWFVVKRPWE